MFNHAHIGILSIHMCVHVLSFWVGVVLQASDVQQLDLV